MVRAKFVVTKITRYENPNSATIELEPRYSKAVPEDQRFSEATPSGKLEMYVNNPKVIEFLTPGKVCYIDITEAPAGTSSFHE
jgi:hypothetical protein